MLSTAEAAREVDRQRAFAVGFRAHVPQPVVPAVLATAILKLVVTKELQNA